MKLNWKAVIIAGAGALSVLLVVVLVASWASDDTKGTLTIYSSLPLVASYRTQSEDIVRGERLALREAGSRVGDYKISFISLNDGNAEIGQWDPTQVERNARKAIKDPSTIAYLGELSSGASQVSIPILNEAGILQVSPVSTYVGLTRSQGAAKGEPDKYYPTGTRTFGRIVPADHVQAAASAQLMKDQGCRSLYILNDGEVFGKGIAKMVQQQARSRDINVKRNAPIDARAKDFFTSADKVRSSGAKCFFYGGDTRSNAVRLFTDIFEVNPGIKMFGTDGVANRVFTTGLKSSRLQSHTYITVPTLGQTAYPAEAERFYREFRLNYGRDPEPYAIYGYEAMSVVLDALKRAGDDANNREAVIKSFMETEDRQSVIGKYSIDANGDTTLRDYGVYRVKDGKLVFDRLITTKASTSSRQ